jgi:transposase-like protein
MVEKLAGPHAMSGVQLAAETGVPQPTLSRWLRESTTLRRKMAKRQDDEEQKMAATDAPQRTTEEKFSLVLEAGAIPEAELGEWLRRKGVHLAQLEEWRAQAMAGIGGAVKRGKDTTAADARQIRQLERDLARKDKALAEAAALLVLQKKVQAIWGDEDDDTDKKKDK